VTTSCDVNWSHKPSVASTMKRRVDDGFDEAVGSGRKESLRWVTTGVEVTYGGVLRFTGERMLKLLPTRKAWLSLYDKLSSCFLKE
jgi:hypothetical protein